VAPNEKSRHEKKYRKKSDYIRSDRKEKEKKTTCSRRRKKMRKN